ncbi:ROK family protein [Planctomycetota bacterium]
MKYVAGLDIGGTNIPGGIVDEDGSIHLGDSIKTHAHKGPDYIIKSMGDFVLELIEKSGKNVEAIGIGSPGPLDQENGKIYDSPNLPGWDCIPIVDRMHEHTGLPCVLENDANAACLGEKLFGAGKDYNNIVHLTLGTGIGGGLFLDGKLFRGADGAGAELGHMVIDAGGYQCGCGRYGCFEAFCSDSGIRTQVKEELSKHPDSKCNNYDNAQVNFKIIDDLSQEGDEFACIIFDRIAAYFGIGIGNLVNIFNPEAVILSGGMVKAGEDFIEQIRSNVFEQVFDVMKKNLTICVSQLGENTGVLGAAACALMN